MLLEHVISQGGQRVLLRLELHSDAEIERSAIFGDPLRNAFQQDRDQEWGDLNLSVPLRSYCDRLVLETVRQHQTQVSPGYPVRLLTSDQGLARMALAEGVQPLFFKSVAADDLFSRVFTGVVFNPFNGGVYRVPLADLLWELATSFGSASLTTPDKSRAIEVTAMGKDLAWAPIHSHDDLLWVKMIGLGKPTPPAPRSSNSDDVSSQRSATSLDDATHVGVISRSDDEPDEPVGFYRFNVEAMLRLIVFLAEQNRASEKEIQRGAALGDTTEYQKFLASGQLVRAEGEYWIAEEGLDALRMAIRNVDYAALASGFNRVPSFRLFATMLAERRLIRVGEKPPIPGRGIATYRTLGEITCLGAPIAGEALFFTPNNPKPSEFAIVALRRFEEVAKGEGLVAVGAWLEALIREDGIHPVYARIRLEEANAAGLLRRSTEGSTTDTRHDQHSLRVLAVIDGTPLIKTVHLYRGDFLIPSKSSSSLRLEDIGA
jgi:hypothetical protein